MDGGAALDDDLALALSFLEDGEGVSEESSEEEESSADEEEPPEEVPEEEDLAVRWSFMPV